MMLRSLLVLICLVQARGDLYNVSDHVAILTASNIDTVFASPTAWILEFYSSWCGHCQNFAPTWKEFAREVADWDHTIQVGVLDCADTWNSPVCNQFMVKGVPSIRLLAPNSPKEAIGQQSKARTVTDIKNVVIGFLTYIQSSQTETPQPNLINYEGLNTALLNEAPASAKIAILITEDDMSSAGRQTIMEFGNYPQLYIRRQNSSGPMNTTSEIYFKWRDNTELTTTVGRSSLEQIEEIERVTSVKLEQSTTRKPPGSTTPYPQTTVSVPDQVYMVDLENAISYSFAVEPYTYGHSIQGEALKALTDYTAVLVKYFPARPFLHQFLVGMYTYLRDRSVVEAEGITEMIRSLGNGNSSYPPMQEWHGCKGSDPKYRGYPCSLWTLFHVLTVNGETTNDQYSSLKTPKILQAIHGYVKHFFGCRHCSEHFQEMYALDAQQNLARTQDQIMWLWRGHNKVNDRLKEDLTEDPKFPKIQFPTKANCPDCWLDETTFNEPEVLLYLKDLYSSPNISMMGSFEPGIEVSVSPIPRDSSVVGSLLEWFWSFGESL